MTHPTHDFLPGSWRCALCGEWIATDLARHPCPNRALEQPNPCRRGSSAIWRH